MCTKEMLMILTCYAESLIAERVGIGIPGTTIESGNEIVMMGIE